MIVSEEISAVEINMATDYEFSAHNISGEIKPKQASFVFQDGHSGALDIVLDKYQFIGRPNLANNQLELGASYKSINAASTGQGYIENQHDAKVRLSSASNAMIVEADPFDLATPNGSSIIYTHHPNSGARSWFQGTHLNAAMLLETDENDVLTSTKVGLGRYIEATSGSQLIMDTAAGFFVIDIKENTTLQVTQQAVQVKLFTNKGLNLKIYKPVKTIQELSQISLAGPETTQLIGSHIYYINRIYTHVNSYMQHDTLSIILIYLFLMNIIAIALLLLCLLFNKLINNQSRNINDNQTQATALISKNIYSIYGTAIIICSYNMMGMHRYFSIYNFYNSILGISGSSVSKYSVKILFVHLTFVKIIIMLFIASSYMFGHQLVGRGITGRMQAIKGSIPGATIIAVIWTDEYIVKGLLIACLVAISNIYKEVLYRLIYWNEQSTICEDSDDQSDHNPSNSNG